MDRVEGERVKFVVLKRLEYDNKIRRPQEYYWDPLSADQIRRSFPELIYVPGNKNYEEEEMDKQQELTENKEEVTEEKDPLDYDGRAEEMPIRFVVTKDFTYRGEENKDGDVLDWKEITYKETPEEYKKHTKILEMTRKDWIEELEEKKEKSIERKANAEEFVEIRNIPALEVLNPNEKIGERDGGLMRDYSDLKEVDRVLKVVETEIIPQPTKNDHKSKTFIKRRKERSSN